MDPVHVRLESELTTTVYCLLANIAQIAVPEDRQTINKQHPKVYRDKREVDNLHKRPDHPVALQRGLVGLGDLLSWTLALENSHRGQKEGEVGWGEYKLVDGNTCSDLELPVLELDLLKEAEPLCGGWAENGCF